MANENMEEKKLAAAKAAYQTLCKVIESHNWYYEKEEENLAIETQFRGNDLTLQLRIRVDAPHQVIILNSKLPFNVQKEQAVNIAAAINYINKNISDGAFNFNLQYGSIYFRCTEFFAESLISDDVFDGLIQKSLREVDRYNDYLLYLSTGVKSVDDFIAYANSIEDPLQEPEEKVVKKGKEILENLCAYMDENQWKYQKDEEDFSASIAFQTEDLDLYLHFFVDVHEEVVRVLSMLPINVTEAGITPCIIAACETNYMLKDGDFLYDFKNNAIFFKLTSSFKNSLISKAFLKHMFDFAYDVIDIYNDKFAALNDGTMTLEEYMTWLND